MRYRFNDARSRAQIAVFLVHAIRVTRSRLAVVPSAYPTVDPVYAAFLAKHPRLAPERRP